MAATDVGNRYRFLILSLRWFPDKSSTTAGALSDGQYEHYDVF